MMPGFLQGYEHPTSVLVKPKNEIMKERAVGPVYHIACGSCDVSNVGEKKRPLKAQKT